MSPTTAPIRSSYQSCVISEESYCAPWDLKIQEEKLKLLNEQHQMSLSNPLLHSSNINDQSISLGFNHKIFHRTHSVRPSSRKKSFTHRELSPPILPPFPPGGLISSYQCNTNNNTEKIDLQTVRLGANPQPHSNFLIQNNSLPKTPTAYEQPWDALQTSLINNVHGRSLQKIPSRQQHCSSPTYPIVSSCRYSDDMTTIPIDRYFWYHYAISRRQAETILESRSSGSFLVRQSESGNQNDYSLSIKTTKGYVHMRICYSEGFYILGECSRPFSSVSCLIKHFSQTCVPIRGAAHIKLGTPVLRWEILSSSLSNEELL